MEKQKRELTNLEKVFASILIAYFITILIVLFFSNHLPIDKEIALKFYDITNVILPTLVAAT